MRMRLGQENNIKVQLVVEGCRIYRLASKVD